jgi:hypothetical protein
VAVTCAIAGGFKYLIRTGGPGSTVALNNWTVAGWCAPTGTGAAETVELNGSAAAFINIDARSNLCILDVNDNAGHSVALNSIATISGTWNHYAGTWDGTTLKFYINGTLDQSATPGFVFTGNNWSDMQCGPFDGQLQDAVFYSTALTGPQVAALSQTQRLPTISAGLVAYIPLNDTSGADLSGLNNNFTNNSATAGTSQPTEPWSLAAASAAMVQTAPAAAGAAASGAMVETATALPVGSMLAAMKQTASSSASASALAAILETATATGQTGGGGATAFPFVGQGRRFGNRLMPALNRRG